MGINKVKKPYPLPLSLKKGVHIYFYIKYLLFCNYQNQYQYNTIENGDEKAKENAIELKKTDVSNILDVIFKTSFSCRKIDISKRDIQLSDKKITNDKTEIPEKESHEEEDMNRQEKRSSFQRNGKKKSSFMSHLNRRNEQVGFTYIQQTDTLTKIQVKYKERDLVIQFLSVDALQENSKKDPLVLIMVQDMWQEMYQRKVQDIQKDKMRIFASLSHELRTPLNCSISMLEVLKDEISSGYHDYIEEYINPALFSNKLLLNQINDILDFVQMDSGKFKYSFLDFSVESLFRDCQKLISMQAQMKNLEIRINCDPNVPDIICSDPNRIRQIILNFLSNSLKFTKKGFIEIGITNQSGLGSGLYKIYVQDTGIGISKENLETIFSFCAKVDQQLLFSKQIIYNKIFSQKVNYEKKDEGLNTQGCGLGLTISNSIAKGLVKNEIVEGGISVSSDYGFGSVFSIIVQDMNYIEQTTQAQHVKIDKFKNTLPQLVTVREDENQFVKVKQPRTPQSFTHVNKKVHSFGLCSSPTKSIVKKFNSHLMNLSQINTEGDKSSMNEIPTSSFDQSKQKMLKSFINDSVEFEGKQSWTDRKLIHPISSGLKVYDSSIVVEVEDEDVSKKIQLHPNFEVHNSYKFQEEEMTMYQSTKKPCSTSSYKTQQSQQLDSQDQEGFTSYVGFSRFNENGASSRLISTSYKNVDKYFPNFIKSSVQQQHEYSVVDESIKQLSQLESCLSTHKIVEEIINRNIYTKQNCKCCQILIVDDNQFNLYALAKTAQQFSFGCCLASDGIQALEEIKSMYEEQCCLAPKLIFMDIEMPLKNGYEVTKEIIEYYKSIGFHDAPIIIACTAYVGQEDHEKALEAGMNDFINKPILKNAFQQLIINWSHVLM